MASKVSAEGLSVVHKGSGGSVSFTPDVCLTPRPSDPPIPIPYTNSAVSQDADLGSQTVSCEGHPVLVEGSVFAKSTGDEPGSVGGGEQWRDSWGCCVHLWIVQRAGGG